MRQELWEPHRRGCWNRVTVSSQSVREGVASRDRQVGSRGVKTALPTSHMWLLKFKLLKLKSRFFGCTGHISSVQ